MNAPTGNWVRVGNVESIPFQGARVVRTERGDIAVFRTASGDVLAIEDHCPHRGGPLSQGIVHGDAVTCPLHNWVISLRTGIAEGADSGCAKVIPVKCEDGFIYLCQSALGALAAA